MKTTTRATLLGLAACGKETTCPDCGPSEPPRKTTYFSNAALIERWSRTDCKFVFEQRFQLDSSAPRERSQYTRFRCELPEAIARVHVVTIGSPSAPREICAIRLGPDVMEAPVKLDFIKSWFLSRAHGAKVFDLVRKQDAAYEYVLATVVDGLRVWIEQYNSVDGPTLFVDIDGCGRVPNDGELVVSFPPKGEMRF